MNKYKFKIGLDIFYSFFITLFLINIVGILENGFTVYNNLGFKGLIDYDFYNQIFDIKTYINYFNILSKKNNPVLLILYIITYFINIFILYMFLYDDLIKFFFKKKKIHEKATDYGSHGTADWQTDEEIQKNYKENDKMGWFMGSTEKNTEYSLEENKNYMFHSVKNINNLNMQNIVIGPPNSNKTTGYVLPNLLHIPKIYQVNGLDRPDMVVTDPKGELIKVTAKYYEKIGYEVKILDFISQSLGDSINMLSYLDEDKLVYQEASNFIHALSGAKNHDDFWTKASINLLTAIMGYVIQKRPKEKQTMTEVVNVLQSPNVSDIELAKVFFQKEGLTGIALYCWNNFISSSGSAETYASILVSLLTDLALFSYRETQHQTKTNTVQLKKIGKKLTTQEEKEEIEKEYLRLLKIKNKRYKRYEEISKTLEYRLRLELQQVIEVDENKDLNIYKSEIDQEIMMLINESIHYEEAAGKSKKNTVNILNNEKERKEFINKRLEELNNVAEKIKIYNKKLLKMDAFLNKHINNLAKLKEQREEIKTKPIILYILISDSDSSLKPMVNSVVNTVFRQLYENARLNNDELEVPVYTILEEFCNIGKIKNIETMAGTMRSRRIYPMIIIQSLSQMKNVYEKEWESIVSQCDTITVLGVNDLFTADQITKRLNETTIKIQSQTDVKTNSFFNDFSNLSESYTGRNLLKTNELMGLENEKIIIIQRSVKPLIAYKCQFKHWSDSWKDMLTNRKDIRKIKE